MDDTQKILLRSREKELRSEISAIEDIRHWFVDNNYDDEFGFSSMINDLDNANDLLRKCKKWISEHVDCMDKINEHYAISDGKK